MRTVLWWGMQALLLLGVPCAAAGQGTAETQPPPVMLRVTSRVVVLSAVVQAKDATAATGLTKDDFELKQDGKPVDLRFCNVGGDLPLTVALMVDTSGSQRTLLGDETIASDVFLQTVMGRPQDRAVVVQFDSRVRAVSDLTDAVGKLHLSLLSLSIDPSARGGTLLNDAVDVVSSRLLLHETGRKAMILLTDGGDNGSRNSVDQAVRQAQLADVQIYSILYSDDSGGGPLSLHPPVTDPGRDTLRKLSESTGGRMFEVSRSLPLRRIYAEIAQELRLQYQVGYTPPPDLQPGSYHRLELRMKDRKLTVQARKGFFVRP